MMMKEWTPMETQKYYRVRLMLMSSALILLAFLLWKVGTQQEAALERRIQGEYEIRMETKPLSADVVSQMVEKEREVRRKEKGTNSNGLDSATLFTAWTQINETKVRLPDRNREVSATALLMAGDNTPRFTLNSDRNCVVSEDLAYRLWGTPQVIGETLVMAGKKYAVERVELGEKSWVLIRGSVSGFTEVTFDVLTIIPQEKAFGNSLEVFLSRHDIKSDMTFQQEDLFHGIHTLRVLPYWTLALGFAICLCIKGRSYWKVKAFRWSSLFFASGACVLVFCGIAAGPLFVFPDAFIPTRWSDFSFWERTLETLRLQWDYFTTMQIYLPNQELRMTGMKVFVESMAGALLLFAGGRKGFKIFLLLKT